MIRFDSIFPEICFAKFKIFELSSQIYVNIKELDCLLRNQQFFCPKQSSPTQQKPTRGNLINQRVYFESSNEYQSFKLTAEIHLTEKN